MSDTTKREQIVEEINVTSTQDPLELNSEKTEPLRYTANPSLPQMDILIPTESVIQNSMHLRHHGKALSMLRDKYIKKRMKNHVIVNTVFGSKQFSDKVLGSPDRSENSLTKK